MSEAIGDLGSEALDEAPAGDSPRSGERETEPPTAPKKRGRKPGSAKKAKTSESTVVGPCPFVVGERVRLIGLSPVSTVTSVIPGFAAGFGDDVWRVHLRMADGTEHRNVRATDLERAPESVSQFAANVVRRLMGMTDNDRSAALAFITECFEG